MKKLLGILVLGLLLSSKAYAETVELEQGIKLNIPKGYTYVELNYKDYQDENAQGFLSNKELKEYYENMGITGTEKVLIIGKDVVYGMVNFYQHDLDGKKPEEWKGLVEIAKKCESKNSEKAFMKCFVKTMADPYMEVFVSGTGSPEIDELSNIVQEIKNDPDLQKEAKKFSEKIEKNFSGLGKVKGKVKMVHLDKKKWGVVVVSKTRTMGIKLTKEMYLFPHNNHVFSIAGACISKTNCKDIAKKVIEVLQPYLLNDIAKKTETKETKKKAAKKKEVSTENKEVTWTAYAGKDDRDLLSGSLSGSSSNFKKKAIVRFGTSDQQNIFNEVVSKAINKCKVRLNFIKDKECHVFRIKYSDKYGEQDAFSGSIKSALDIDKIKVKWEGISGEITSKKIKVAKKEKKKEPTQTDDSNDIIQQIKDLNELYKSGALTKEQFTKAKKKLLN